jgi:hypothetical protein
MHQTTSKLRLIFNEVKTVNQALKKLMPLVIVNEKGN